MRKISFDQILSLVMLWGGLCLLSTACASSTPVHPESLLRPTALASLAPVGWQIPMPTVTPLPKAASPTMTPRAVAGWGKAHQLAWTAEGELLLWADSGLLTYDAENLALRRMYPWPFNVAGLAFTPAGDQVVFTEQYRYNWRPGAWWIETQTGTLERILQTGCSVKMTFALDGEALAVACDPTELWSANGALSPARIPGRWNDALAFSPDRRWLAASRWNEIRLWERTTQRLEAIWPNALNEPITALTFSPDSATLAALSEKGNLQLWDVAQQSVRAAAYVRGYRPGMRYSPDGAVLVTWGERVDLRDPQTGALQNNLAMPRGSINDVAFSLDGKTLAVLSEGEIALWDAATLERHPYGLRDHIYPVYQVACSPDGQRLLTIDNYGLVQVRDPMTLHVIGDWRGDWHTAYATDPTVTYLAGWDRDERVLSLHQAVDGRVVFTATTSRPTAMAFDGTERLATADNIGHIRLWDVATGKIVTRLTQGRISVTRLALAPAGHRLASSDAAGRLSLYRIRTDHAYIALYNPPFITATLEVPLTHTVALAFAPDGNTVAALFSQAKLLLQVVRLWDAETGKLHREWVVPDRDARDLVWNLDGSRLAVSTSKGVYVWDSRDGREVVRLPRGGAGYTGGQMAFCARDDWEMLAVSHGSWVGLWDIP